MKKEYDFSNARKNPWEKSTMNNLEKTNEVLQGNPELMEKVMAETKRLAEAKEAATPEEAMVKAIRTVLDIDVTEAELKESKKLSLDELDHVAGGSLDDVADAIESGIHKAGCFFGYHSWVDNRPSDDPHAIYTRWCKHCGLQQTVKP